MGQTMQKSTRMNVLVACEYSGTVRNAFRSRGHNAYSCDLLPSDDESPYHFHCDLYDVISREWDIIIAHPPCTALTVAGNGTYGEGMPKHSERILSAIWTKNLWDNMLSVCDKVCLENPVGVLRRLAGFHKPQYIQPYQFGHLEQKKTALFLNGLPELKETNNVYNEMMKLPKKERQKMFYMGPSKDRWKDRSKTYDGIAQAMAEQWG